MHENLSVKKKVNGAEERVGDTSLKPEAYVAYIVLFLPAACSAAFLSLTRSEKKSRDEISHVIIECSTLASKMLDRLTFLRVAAGLISFVRPQVCFKLTVFVQLQVSLLFDKGMANNWESTYNHDQTYTLLGISFLNCNAKKIGCPVRE